MANGITTAFWSVTINNYTEADLALVQNGYPDYCREIVHTLEQGGEKGTPHIQAWVKLQRQQRASFIKKLFPRAHYRPLTSDEYNQNTKVYAQKLDDTAVSAAVHKFHDPLRTLDPTVKLVVSRMMEINRERFPVDMTTWVYDDAKWEEKKSRIYAERQLVSEDFRYAKIFVSATYKNMWKEFGTHMCDNILTHTHTHTHTSENNVAEVDIPTIDAEGCDEGKEENDSRSESSEGDDEDYEGGSDSEDEGYDTSGSSSDCSSDA